VAAHSTAEDAKTLQTAAAAAAAAAAAVQLVTTVVAAVTVARNTQDAMTANRFNTIFAPIA
jgi:hypothetical protein